MASNRRSFLRNTALASLATSPALQFVFRGRAHAQVAVGFGPLVQDPDGILDLPEGFTYKILDEAGDTMSDGYRVPDLPDGMGAFEGAAAGQTVLMRNHEITGTRGGAYSSSDAPAEAYSTEHVGGVTRLVLDDNFDVVSSNLVLTGTLNNCAGGLSPFGWLSCEEPNFSFDSEPDHGFVFVCDHRAEALQMPDRIPAFGRFNHEAAAMDPDSMITYLTEDDSSGLLYRFKPDDAGEPFVGTLQAMRIVGEPTKNTGTGVTTGETFTVDWVDIADPTGQSQPTRTQGANAGAAIVVRGEGLWIDGGVVYFVSTSGGPIERGQIFKLTPDGDGGTLEVLAQSEDRAVLEAPDNITVAPWGDAFVAEDGSNSADQLVRGITPDGEIYDFASNRVSEGSSIGEMAGVCFSPDGRAMFVNLQKAGLTLAITGPFPGVDVPGGDGDGDGDGGPVEDEDDDGGCSVAGASEPGAGVALAAAGLGAVTLAGRRRRDADSADES